MFERISLYRPAMIMTVNPIASYCLDIFKNTCVSHRSAWLLLEIKWYRIVSLAACFNQIAIASYRLAVFTELIVSYCIVSLISRLASYRTVSPWTNKNRIVSYRHQSSPIAPYRPLSSRILWALIVSCLSYRFLSSLVANRLLSFPVVSHHLVSHSRISSSRIVVIASHRHLLSIANYRLL